MVVHIHGAVVLFRNACHLCGGARARRPTPAASGAGVRAPRRHGNDTATPPAPTRTTRNRPYKQLHTGHDCSLIYHPTHKGTLHKTVRSGDVNNAR